MTREGLISDIQEGIKTEESAITIYARHLAAIASRSGLPESKMSQIRRPLEVLIKANREHKNLLDSLLRRIQGESTDVC